jgi:hypothetical protein
MKTLFLAGISMVFSMTAIADEVGEATMTMSRMCEGASTGFGQRQAQSYCNIYLMGIKDMNLALKFAFHFQLFCPPAGAELDQLRLVVNKYVTEHPEALDQAFGGLAIAALMTAFPCEQERPPNAER